MRCGSGDGPVREPSPATLRPHCVATPPNHATAASVDDALRPLAMGRRGVIALLLMTAFLLANAWLAYRNTNALQADERRVIHSHQVIEALTSLMSNLQDVETGQRGYVITGDPMFLTPYDEARARLATNVQGVRSLINDNQAQQRRLDALLSKIDSRVAFAATNIETRRTRGFAAAQAEVLSGAGREQMDAIRNDVAQMEQVELTVLREREEDAARRHRVATSTNLFASAVGLTLLGCAWWLVKRDGRTRHQAALALHEQREWYRTTLSSIGDGVIATDDRGTVAFMNRVAENLTGWQERDAIGTEITSVFPLVNARTREAVDNPVTRVLTTGEPAVLATHTALVGRDGTERLIDDTAAPIKRKAGPLVGVVLVFRDVTAQRRTAVALAESEERFRQVAMMTGEWVWEQEPSGRYLYSNGTVKALLGYEPSEMVGRHYSELFVPSQNQLAEPRVPDHLAGRERFFRVIRHYRRRDGREVIVESNGEPVFDADGAIVKWRGVDRDVTEQVRHEERLKLVVENAPVAMLAVDRSGTISLANAQAERLFGYPRTELVGRSVDLLVPQDARARHPQQREAFFSENRSRTLGHDRSLQAVRRDGVAVPVQIGLTPIELGHESYALAAVVDVSLHRSIEEALRAADRNKNQFLATLAHELRNPLAPVRNAVKVLGRTSGDETVIWARELIDRHVGTLTRLVDDLLDLSRIAEGKLALMHTVVDLGAVARQAIEAVAAVTGLKQHDLRADLPDELVLVDGDTTRLVQIATNLIHNALKYTEQGGRIDVSVRSDASDAVLSVRDTGIGIGPEMLPRVFEMFVQEDEAGKRAPGGLGIGLALVRQLVELHGGTVRAMSAGPGQGSEFVVRLPLASSASEAAAPRVSHSANRRRRVLIVDDEPDSADSMAVLLSLEGYDVKTAHSGSTALTLLPSFAPEAVLLDIGLPDVSGYDVATEIRRARPDDEILLIATSGYGSQEDLERSKHVGFDHHLVKPVDPDVLLDLLRRP